jgi:hypothetical protein
VPTVPELGVNDVIAEKPVVLEAHQSAFTPVKGFAGVGLLFAPVVTLTTYWVEAVKWPAVGLAIVFTLIWVGLV